MALADDADTFAADAARLYDRAPGVLSRACRSGGHYADLFYEHTVYHRLSLTQRLEGGRLAPPREADERRVDAGAGIHVVAPDETAYVSTADLSPAALDACAVEAAQSLSGAAGRRPVAAVPAPLPASPGTGRPLPPDAPDAVTTAEKAALLRAAAEAAFALDPRVRTVEAAYLDRVRRTAVLTTDGHHVHTESPLLGLRLSVTLEVDGEPVTAYALAGGSYGLGHFLQHPPEELAREAVRRARRRAEAVGREAPNGPMPVVVAGGWGGVWLHEAVGHLLEADVAARGRSPWADRIGEHVAPAEVTLLDDATQEGGRGTAAFDDEGLPTDASPLVAEGVLVGLLTDRRHAGLLGLPRTGSARRQDFRHAPAPRMSNLLLLEGSATPGDLVGDVEAGLYVRTIGGGVVHADEDRFSFDVLEGNRIENGHLGAPVAGVRVHGPASGILGRLDGIADDFRLDTTRGLCRKADQTVPVSVGTPTVLLRSLTVEG